MELACFLCLEASPALLRFTAPWLSLTHTVQTHTHTHAHLSTRAQALRHALNLFTHAQQSYTARAYTWRLMHRRRLCAHDGSWAPQSACGCWSLPSSSPRSLSLNAGQQATATSHIYTYTHIHIYTYTHIHIYTYTHIHTILWWQVFYNINFQRWQTTATCVRLWNWTAIVNIDSSLMSVCLWMRVYQSQQDTVNSPSMVWAVFLKVSSGSLKVLKNPEWEWLSAGC